MKPFLFLMLLVCLCCDVPAQVKVVDLPSTNAATTSDLLIIETQPASASRKTRKITTGDLISSLGLSQGGAATNAVASINSQTNTAQTIAVGTSGTDFAVSSSAGTHTLNLPTASGANRGALASADFITFSNKQAALGFAPVNKAGDTMTGPLLVTGLTNNALTASRAVVSGADKSLASSAATSTEVGYLSGVTSAIQTQLDAKQSTLTFGLGLTNINGTVTNNIEAGSNITLTAGANGKITIAASAGAAGDSVSVDGSPTVDPNFDDGGDINFAYSTGTITATVKSDSVALGTDTTGNYAAGDAEAGAALTGDSATAFFSSGQIERARGGTGADTSAYGVGLLGSDVSNNTIDVDTEAELETALAGANVIISTEIDTLSELNTLIGDANVPSDATTLTIAGTANEITSSAGAQDLSANRTWTLSLPSALTFTGKTVTGGTFNSGTFGLDASGFNGNLATTDDTLQEVSQKVDDLVLGGSDNWVASGTTNSTLPGTAYMNTGAVTNDFSVSGTVLMASGIVTNNIGSLLSVGDSTYVDLLKASQTNAVSGAVSISYATNGTDLIERTHIRWFFNGSGSDQTLTIPSGWRTNVYSAVPAKITNSTITRMVVTGGGATSSAALQTNCYVSFEYFK